MNPDNRFEIPKMVNKWMPWVEQTPSMHGPVVELKVTPEVQRRDAAERAARISEPSDWPLRGKLSSANLKLGRRATCKACRVMSLSTQNTTGYCQKCARSNQAKKAAPPRLCACGAALAACNKTSKQCRACYKLSRKPQSKFCTTCGVKLDQQTTSSFCRSHVPRKGNVANFAWARQRKVAA